MRFNIALASLIASAAAASITDCHFHGEDLYCIDEDGNEGVVSPSPSSEDAASRYTSCHNHGTATYCMSGDEEVEFLVEATATGTEEASETGHDHDHDHASETEEHDHAHTEDATETGHSHESESSGSHDDEEMDCHFHAGVEHCVPRSGESETHSHESEATCARVDRDYNIPLRIGLIFAMLATSALGVFGPILLNVFLKLNTDSLILGVIKQFGTGVIISTAFVHLLTHAQLMFNNECLTNINYEATCAAIVMAGLLIAFLVDYVSKRLVQSRDKVVQDAAVTNTDSEKNAEKIETDSTESSSTTGTELYQDKVAVLLLEAGIIFHSILIGITLVVAGDSYFITLFIVIVFHQFFEGLALGARIASVKTFGLFYKLILAGAFALITPIGMAIGTGVLQQFNGNDPATIIAIGTLDAFSAGVLIWIGVVGMWAHDWFHGKLVSASWLFTGLSFVAFVAGLILMSVLGKWA